ncbi:MAG: EF-hand domain-containing protein [Planctomycetota bacterium]|jgi:Ca2+-binding EF-hand superfamily protein
MKTRKSRVVAVTIAFALLASMAIAGKSYHKRHRQCEDPIPEDKQAKLLEHFGEKGIDADKNGTLTCEEVKAFMKENRPKGSRHHGHHRECTDPIPEDKQTGLLEHFGEKGIDADKNGTLTCEEVKAFMKENRPKGSRHHGHHWECEDPIPEDKQTKLLEKFGSKGIDADKDGTLTCKELRKFFAKHRSHHSKHEHMMDKCTDPISKDKQTRLLEKFGSKGIDADKDGTLTCKELKKFFAKHRSYHSKHGHMMDKCTDPISKDKQTRLLEKFGSKGIDADKDGTLTCKELKTFFAKHHRGGKDGKTCGSGKSAHHGKKGKPDANKEKSSCSGEKKGK